MNREYEFEREDIEALRLWALCLLKMQDYKGCISILKRCIEMAFRINDNKTEIKCYGQLSICYFYLKDIDNTRHFTNRFIAGMAEKGGSRVRKTYETYRSNNQRMKVMIKGKASSNYADLFQRFYETFMLGCKKEERLRKALYRGLA